jgi:hypothetical protein
MRDERSGVLSPVGVNVFFNSYRPTTEPTSLLLNGYGDPLLMPRLRISGTISTLTMCLQGVNRGKFSFLLILCWRSRKCATPDIRKRGSFAFETSVSGHMKTVFVGA